MLVVISPAKKLDMRPVEGITPTRPAFAAEAGELAQAARGLQAEGLERLMKISPGLARLNAERFAAFGTMTEKPAALAFAGDTYQGLEAGSLKGQVLLLLRRGVIMARRRSKPYARV